MDEWMLLEWKGLARDEPAQTTRTDYNIILNTIQFAHLTIVALELLFKSETLKT